MLKQPPITHSSIDDIANYLVGEFPHQVLAIQWKEQSPIFIVHHRLGVRHDVLVTPEFLRHNGQCVEEIEQLGLSKLMRDNRNQAIQLVVDREGIQIEPRVKHDRGAVSTSSEA